MNFIDREAFGPFDGLDDEKYRHCGMWVLTMTGIIVRAETTK